MRFVLLLLVLLSFAAGAAWFLLGPGLETGDGEADPFGEIPATRNGGTSEPDPLEPLRPRPTGETGTSATQAGGEQPTYADPSSLPRLGVADPGAPLPRLAPAFVAEMQRKLAALRVPPRRGLTGRDFLSALSDVAVVRVLGERGLRAIQQLRIPSEQVDDGTELDYGLITHLLRHHGFEVQDRDGILVIQDLQGEGREGMDPAPDGRPPR